MGKIDINEVPVNVRKYAGMTKLELLRVISSLDDSNKCMLKQLFIDEETISESVKGLVNKSRTELLQIIARKDATEIANQELIKANEANYNKLYTELDNLSSDYKSLTNNYNNAKVGRNLALLLWVITIIAYFVL